MESVSVPRALIWIGLAAAACGALVGIAGSFVLGLITGVIVAVLLATGVAVTSSRGSDHDPARRRFLATAGVVGLVTATGASGVGWLARKRQRPDPTPALEEMATAMGAGYMELVQRAYMPGRSGDIQLMLAPFNSANYSFESLTLVPQDPRTSHAATWMYLERIPLVVYGPGTVEPSDSDARVSLADLAPTTAGLIGLEWPDDRAGRRLQIATSPSARTPKVVVTYVFDGGGWNVLNQFPDAWPNLRRLMSGGANFRNALVGSFPAVTACAHATIGTGAFPNAHGITGHNIRDGAEVRKAYREPGMADPSDIVIPTLADMWSDHTDNAAWVGEIGYQVWHLGMLGAGGTSRTGDQVPVGVYWAEDGSRQWEPHHPERYRLPAQVPGLEVLEGYTADFEAPDWDAAFAPKPGSRQSPCCSPPIVAYQGDLIQATFDSEPIGRTGTTDLLYTTYKSPDYTGHVYGMFSEWTGLQLNAVDEQLGRLEAMLEARFPGEYVLMVTADHGQCPLPDAEGGVRLDPIQLQQHVEAEFGGGFNQGLVQNVVPSEIYLDSRRLWDNGGATSDDVAAYLRDYVYRQNIGPYVPRSAIEADMLNEREFAAVFSTTYLDTLVGRDLAGLGATEFPDGDYPMPGPIS